MIACYWCNCSENFHFRVGIEKNFWGHKVGKSAVRYLWSKRFEKEDLVLSGAVLEYKSISLMFFVRRVWICCLDVCTRANHFILMLASNFKNLEELNIYLKDNNWEKMNA
jgi:hypothetical protein